MTSANLELFSFSHASFYDTLYIGMPHATIHHLELGKGRTDSSSIIYPDLKVTRLGRRAYDYIVGVSAPDAVALTQTPVILYRLNIMEISMRPIDYSNVAMSSL